jgi:hypothetical protein
VSEAASKARDLRRRHRRAVERLMENATLRASLVDKEASRLLNWGIDRLERTVRETIDLSEEAAEPILEAKIEAVSAVMRQVNAVVDSTEGTDEVEGGQRGPKGKRKSPLVLLVTEVTRLEGALQAVEAGESLVENVTAELQDLDREGVFEWLMSFIDELE